MKLVRLFSGLIQPQISSDHRLAPLKRFAKWQAGVRILDCPVVAPFVNKSRLVVRKSMHGATGNIYHGLLEFEDMSFLLHFLRKDDLFGDIGANVGVYSILASAVVGARSIAVEPIPFTAECFLDNVSINRINDLVELHRVGVSDEQGKLRFTTSLDAMNRVSFDESEHETLEVEILTLDTLFSESRPILLKIDVEGFELPALKGGNKILNDGNLKAVLIEINGSGNNYGIDDDSIHSLLISHGFLPHRYCPMTRAISSLETYSEKNTLYLRDLRFAQMRVSSAPPFSVNGHTI